FSFFFYFLGMLEHLVLFLTDEGMPRSEATAYFSNAIGLGLVSKVVLGLIADRIHHKIALLVDYALLALSSVLLLFLPHPTLLPVFILVFGFSVAARDVVYPLILTHCFGLRFMAAIYGALILALLPGGTLGPIYTAWVHDRFGSYDLAFQTFAVLNLLSVLALDATLRVAAPLVLAALAGVDEDELRAGLMDHRELNATEDGICGPCHS
ncbi:MAG: hypothetical protein IH822_09200, partial [Chloroflexi bacterium]|nr:hypothetical protein [Chloroflexota bacterium]